jgi:hypothetical protein
LTAGSYDRRHEPAVNPDSAGLALVLSRVHWVEPKLVAEIAYPTLDCR